MSVSEWIDRMENHVLTVERISCKPPVNKKAGNKSWDTGKKRGFWQIVRGKREMRDDGPSGR